ncbi:MAG: CorA family divalent cation transporter [Candidatus Thermoplasmatota archaeon]
MKWSARNSADTISEGVMCIALMPDGTVMRQHFETGALADCRGLVDKANVAWVNIALSEMVRSKDVAEVMGFTKDLVISLLEEHTAEYEDREIEMGVQVPAVRVHGFDVRIYPLLVLVRRNLVLSIHPLEVVRFLHFSRYAEGFMRKFKKGETVTDRATSLLIRILDENNERNFDGLRSIQSKGEQLSELPMSSQSAITTFASEIHRMKMAIFDYLEALWGSLDVMNSLRHGDADAISDDPKLLQRIGMLVDDIRSQIGLTEHVGEVLASGHEVLQTIYNNQLQQLNNKLALLATWLAIIATAIAVPNTLATIFGIASISDLFPWQVTAFLVVMSTIISAYITYLVLKAKGWFAREM